MCGEDESGVCGEDDKAGFRVGGGFRVGVGFRAGIGFRAGRCTSGNKAEGLWHAHLAKTVSKHLADRQAGWALEVGHD